MKLGMINNQFTLESYQQVKQRGLSFVEICCNYDKDTQALRDAVPQIQENLRVTGLVIGSVGRWNSQVNRGGKLDEQQFSTVKCNLDSAVAVGAPVFVCGFNYDDSVSRFRNYCAAVEYFGQLTDYARSKGITVAVCNCSWSNFIVSPETWSVVLGEIPELMLKYDCSHAYNEGRDYLKELSDWGERIAHFHIKGTVKSNGVNRVSDPPAGMDDLMWGSIFATLYARNYDGNLSIEPHSSTWKGGTELGDRGILFTIDYIRKFMLR